METITMTEFNQRVSATTRHVVDSGESVQVTSRGKAVLRLIPEPAAEDPLEKLIEQGLAEPPLRKGRPQAPKTRIVLSRSIDEILAEDRADRDA